MADIDSNKFNVNLNAFSGSLDVLLDLAKSQKVNLENISVSKLADQFHDFIRKSCRFHPYLNNCNGFHKLNSMSALHRERYFGQ